MSWYVALDRISGELDAVAIECLDLLIVYYTYRGAGNPFADWRLSAAGTQPLRHGADVG